MGEGGGEEVVGAGEGVEGGDGEGVVGVLSGLPGWVAERGGGGERGRRRRVGGCVFCWDFCDCDGG